MNSGPKAVGRRHILKLIGGGTLATLTAPVGSASKTKAVFVRPADGQRAVTNAVRAHNGTVTQTYKNFAFIAARVPVSALDNLRADSRVATVEPDGPVHALHHKDGHDGGPPGDGGGDNGCGDHPAQSPSWGWERINASDAHSDARGNGVDVAILDTGIDAEHCDLDVHGGTNCTGKGNGFDDKNGHGTHCAGIASALDNSIGVVGVAPAANLWAVKVLDNSGSGSWSNVVCGIDWCMTHKKEILSMSFGASSMPDTVHSAISDTYEAGHLLVAAAGNEGNDEDGSCEEKNVIQPARHPDVIGVSAMDESDSDGTLLADYSSVGVNVELMAPGTAIRSTYTNDSYDTLSGTSMACPHVTGTAALAWEDLGSDGPETGDRDTIRQTMREQAEPVLGTCEDGYGLIRPDKVVAELSG